MASTCKKAYILLTTENTFFFNIFLLKCMPCIYNPMHFKKDQANIQALLDSVSKINVIILVYAANLDLKIWPTNIGAQKIYNSIFEIFKMIQTSFQIHDNLKISRFYKEILLRANTNIEMIWNIHIIGFSNGNIKFRDQKLIQKFYIIIKVLTIIKNIEFINKKKFTKATLNKKLKTFMLYITALKALLFEIIIHFYNKVQIAIL